MLQNLKIIFIIFSRNVLNWNIFSGLFSTTIPSNPDSWYTTQQELFWKRQEVSRYQVQKGEINDQEILSEEIYIYWARSNFFSRGSFFQMARFFHAFRFSKRFFFLTGSFFQAVGFSKRLVFQAVRFFKWFVFSSSLFFQVVRFFQSVRFFNQFVFSSGLFFQTVCMNWKFWLLTKLSVCLRYFLFFNGIFRSKMVFNVTHVSNKHNIKWSHWPPYCSMIYLYLYSVWFLLSRL